MFYPTFDAIAQLRALELKEAGQDNSDTRRPLLPLYRDILADIDTPVSAYCKTAQSPYSFLLESVSGGEHVARYSFIGIDPYMVMTHQGEKAILRKMNDKTGR